MIYITKHDINMVHENTKIFRTFSLLRTPVRRRLIGVYPAEMKTSPLSDLSQDWRSVVV